MRPLLKPRWLIAHVTVLTIAVIFVNLGFWQLRRLDEKRTFNERLLARSTQPVEDVGALLERGSADEAAYRRASARGTFDTANEVVLLSRARKGIAGNHVVTPLVTEDGTAILVDRGWVPFAMDDPPVADAAPPRGDVSVEGILFPSQIRGRFGPRQEPGEVLTQIFRVDVERLRDQFPYPLYPHWMLLEQQTPAQPRELPIPAEQPRLEEGPHLAYAIQWFLFTAILLTGYPALARARLRSRRPNDEGATNVAPSADASAPTSASAPRPS